MMHALGDLFKPEEKEIKMDRDKCSGACVAIWTWKTIVRVICLIAGGVQVFMGGYVFYSISFTKDHSVQNYLSLSVVGFYACLTGLLIIFAETRTRWTRRAVKVFVFLCNGLSRGIIYILIGAIDQSPIPFKFLNYITSMHIGLVCIAGGVVSIVEFLVTYRRNRARLNEAIASHQQQTKGTELYDLFEREDFNNPENAVAYDMEKGKDPNYIHQDLEMQPVQEA
ncbi:hypothetical protein RB653_005908 [Dictyostelium firmibasis]|uniref:Transmembrane protein n=1 Tax=Dictyostelium firmibasis TaxID=79012 RepID=A0AAN7Z4W8_9MYCE